MMNVMGDRKKAAEFLGVAERLKLMLQTIENGKRIDTLKIDPAVTPAIILGYSEEERQKRYNELLKVYEQRFDENKTKATKLLEASKQVKKKEQIEELRKQAQMFMEAAKKEVEEKNKLNLLRKNPWQAPPLTHEETIFTKKERVLSDIPEHQIRVSFKTSPALGKSGGSYIKLKFLLNKETELDHHFYLDKDSVQTWNIDD
jgi:hypothetical protein